MPSFPHMSAGHHPVLSICAMLATANGLAGSGRYVDGPLLLPDGVLLKGAGMALTALYFAEDNKSTAPPSLIATAPPVNASSVLPPSSSLTPPPTNTTRPTGINAGRNDFHARDAVSNSGSSDVGPRFGVEDLCIYVLSYYRNVIDVSVDTVGVRVRRVRIRANAFHCQSRSSEGGPGGGRAVNWTFMGGGANPLVWIHGRNFEFTDCDLWGTWSIFHSSGPVGARFGLIARNEIHNGGACHWFDNAREVIFERNTCTGNNPMAMGNNIDSYRGGCVHVCLYYVHACIGAGSTTRRVCVHACMHSRGRWVSIASPLMYLSAHFGERV